MERGGDFRFHDKEHRTGKDWAMLNPNAKKRQAMTEYIVKTRMFAMTHSGRDVLLERQSSAYMRRYVCHHVVRRDDIALIMVLNIFQILL